MSRRVPSIAAAAVAGSDLPIAFTDEDEVTVIALSGEEEQGITTRGFLKLLAGVSLQDVRPELRPRLTRFQERVRALCAAEAIRANPRDLGDLLVDEFSGRALDEALGAAFEGNPGAFEGIFERMLDACTGALS